MTAFSKHLNATYFDSRLSMPLLAEMNHLKGQRGEVLDFAERLARFFSQACIDATDVPVTFGRNLHEVIPHILPGAWDGMVPSITYPNRHARIDDYLGANRWLQPGPATTLLDLGCGFPPMTSVDTAVRFPDWFVVAMDSAHWPYMIVDRSGDRALFDASRTVRYFQPKQPGATAWRDILNDKESTKSRFRQLLDEMLERLPAGAAREVSSIERDGVLLVLHPVRQYERRNLKFMKGDLLSPGLPKADIVRCFNVLVYFDQSSRHQVFRNVNDVLPEGGILIAGTDWAETMLARYSVYRKEAGKFAAREFAFTLDNLRANLNYFAIHDDDTETCRLVRAVAALRSDQNFFKEFSARHDALHLDYEVCPRGADGYLGDLPDVSGEELARRSLAILRALEEEGYVERATEALRKAGFEAWRNEVGHVAIAPGGELA